MEKIKIRKRIHGTLSAAQARHVKKVQQLVGKELPDLIRRNQLRHDARKEKTFSGMLRRAIHGFTASPMKIAEAAGVSWHDLSAFLTGERTLPSDAIDRLVETLKLKLPTEKSRGEAKAG